MRLHFPKPMRIYLTHDKATEYSQGVNEIPDKVASDYKKIFELNGIKPPEDPKQSVTNTGPDRKPATLEALTAECMKAGYPPQSALKLAQERLAGKHGEEAKFTGAGFQIPSDFAMPVAAPDASKAGENLQTAVDQIKGVPDVLEPTDHEALKPAVDLSAMTKAELVDHAAEVHDLDLKPSATKDELIEQITQAQNAKPAA